MEGEPMTTAPKVYDNMSDEEVQAELEGQDVSLQCERIALPADLRENWTAQLIGAGFEPTRPTAWLAEGLLIYLSADQAANLLSAVGELSAPGSRISFEHGNIAGASLLAQAREMPRMDQYTSLWKGGLGDDAPHWLDCHGWRVRTHDLDTVASSLGRPVPENSGGGFLTAIRHPS
jgi:methyltransferase (TIGR00027 family)